MDSTKLCAAEARFADIVWDNAPLGSGELVKLCAEHLEWKKSTTYTVLKKLCDRGLFQNKDGIVTVRISRQEFQALQSRRFVEETFGGSLPAFIAAFASREEISPQDLADIRKMLDEFGKDGSP